MASWGESLQERREALGLSAEQLGARAGVSGETIRRIERGSKTSALTQSKIEKALEGGSPQERFDALDERFSLLEREVAELRRDLAAVLGFAERLVVQQAPPPAGPRPGPRGR